MLENYFNKNNYQIIYPENIPLNELIDYMQNADNVAAMSGSDAHNILFAKDTTKLTILERNALINN